MRGLLELPPMHARQALAQVAHGHTEMELTDPAEEEQGRMMTEWQGEGQDTGARRCAVKSPSYRETLAI